MVVSCIEDPNVKRFLAGLEVDLNASWPELKQSLFVADGGGRAGWFLGVLTIGY